jgi:GDP-4-dehydro-6-deoxy-D-mannose reductase
LTSSSGLPPVRRILLTGGGGFVGGYLAPMLLAAFPESEKFMLRHPAGPTVAREGFAQIEADLVDRDAVGAIVSRLRPDLVLHLAAQSSVGASAKAAENTWRVNFDGTFALASACAGLAQPVTFFFTSSAEVYGLGFREGMVAEETPLQPQNAYARSKAAAEGMLLDVLPESARLIVTRSFNHTGPGQDTRFVLPSFAAQIAAIEAGRQKPRMEVGNLDAERDFLDVRDVCDAYLKLILAAGALPHPLTVNVSSGSALRIGDLLALLKSKARCDFAIDVDPRRLRPSDIPSAVGSNDKLRGVVDWRPSTPIETTLEALLAHARRVAREEIRNESGPEIVEAPRTR